MGTVDRPWVVGWEDRGARLVLGRELDEDLDFEWRAEEEEVGREDVRERTPSEYPES